MRICLTIILFLAATAGSLAQNAGIIRKNYMSSYFDSMLNMQVTVFDSATIRLGRVDPLTGNVINIGSTAYNMGINLNGATVDPYSNHYYIGSGFNLLTFDMLSGNLVNNVPITGNIPTGSFQNYRFNPADSVVYGLVPENFYSTYYDSLTMSFIQVLDSARIRFASIDPVSGQYTLIGNTSYKNVYTLAGNSIDPHQMLYYYSAVDTLVAIDIYNGSLFSEAAIQLPPGALFENFTYSCADTSIYGLTRQNYFSTVYDSILMDFVTVIDSTTFRLSKVNPATGAVTFISPADIGIGGTLTGSCFIDPATMTYYFSSGANLIGVSLTTGLITSSLPFTFQSGAFAFDVMRGVQNCYGAAKVRDITVTDIPGIIASPDVEITLVPNPANESFRVVTAEQLKSITLIDLTGKTILTSTNNTIDLAAVSSGLYFVKVQTMDGRILQQKLIRN